MDNYLAIGLTVVLLLRGLPFVASLLPGPAGRRLRNQMLRFRALLDVACGTLMVALVVLLIMQRAWIAAALLGAISIPVFSGLVAALRVLARTPR